MTSDRIFPPSIPDDIPPEASIGITTTVPVEVLLAAGRVPVDLNNLFVTHAQPHELVAQAERAGFPRTCCCWTKGLYGAAHDSGVGAVLGVTRGDCSNAEALLEMLEHEGVRCARFDYPATPDVAAMERAVAQMAESFGADVAQAEEQRLRLDVARQRATEIDRLTWQDGAVHGVENHIWLVSTSDFCGAVDAYVAAADEFIARARARSPIVHAVRLGLCGVPPIVPGLYDFVEQHGALVVYNETQRQFAMPAESDSLAEQYTRYTYPYGIFRRLADIRRECECRRMDGLIHYVQSFCHHRIEDRIVRDGVDLPVLTIEADAPGPLSGQIKTRLEAFVQIVTARLGGGGRAPQTPVT